MDFATLARWHIGAGVVHLCGGAIRGGGSNNVHGGRPRIGGGGKSLCRPENCTPPDAVTRGKSRCDGTGDGPGATKFAGRGQFNRGGRGSDESGARFGESHSRRAGESSALVAA